MKATIQLVSIVLLLAGCGAAPENKEAPARSAMGWTEMREKIIRPRCLGCHFAGNHEKLTDLGNYKNFRAIAGSALFLTMVKGAMPPAPNIFPRDEKITVATWIIDGMKSQ